MQSDKYHNVMQHYTYIWVITYLSKVEVTHTWICNAGVNNLLKLSRHHFGAPWCQKNKLIKNNNPGFTASWCLQNIRDSVL